MHESVLKWVKEKVDSLGIAGGKTLEVGSLDVNGSVRQFFSGEYVGLDLKEGPGVDMVGDSHGLPFAADEFDTVISTEMLEHDDKFWLTLQEIGRVLKPGGYLILTARGNGFGRHDYPQDLYRFMPDAPPVLAKIAGLESVESTTDPYSPGIFLLARKQR